MATKLFESIIFGPIKSRRLGVSLGVNLLATDTKICSFECVYCECGFTPQNVRPRFADKNETLEKLEAVLKSRHENDEPLDVITFAGNGEPTMHPQFAEIMEATIQLRNTYFPNSKISVLSNATMLHKASVVETLKKVDNNILKLDAGVNDTARLMDQPHNPDYDVEKIAEQMKQFDGKFILQTMFLRGEVNGQHIDNTTDAEVEAWTRLVEISRPQQIMMYSLDRDTPLQTLQKVSKEEMEKIAEPLRKKGYQVSVAG